MEVEEEFAPTSRPTMRYTEPELAKQTQVPRKVRVATCFVITDGKYVILTLHYYAVNKFSISKIPGYGRG